MKKFNKRIGRSRSGVSDIIGNLLILAITVTLFSSIMFYVANMPEPAEATYTDLEPNLSNVQDDSTIWVNVTHKGGQTLKDWSTGIYIFVNGTLNPELSVGDGGIDGDWSTGEVWRYKVNFSNEITSLSIMIVDKDTNSIVWQTDLLGGVTDIQLPPIIGTRYTSPSPGLENRSMTLFVQVMDPNGDEIIGVFADMTGLGLGSKELTKVSQNLYSTLIAEKAMYEWDNRKILITAQDAEGSSSALMTIHVNPTSDNNGGNNNGGDGEFGQFDISGLQGFAIFEREDWEENGFDADKRNVFVKGDEDAVVVLITKTVVNTLGKNQLLVMDASTKTPVPEVSSPTNIYRYYSFVAGFYVYNVTIDTATLSGNYSISSTITDSKPISDTFTMNSWIYVADYLGEDTGFPLFKTYKDSGFNTEWRNFSVSDSSLNKIYVEVETELTSPYVLGSGNIEIRDFVWNTQIKRSPASPMATDAPTTWNGPVSNMWQFTDDGHGVYRFVINLANATTGAEWIAGNNAYILRFDIFKTTGESYLLTSLIYVDGPETKYDIVAALPSAFGSAWGAQASLFYYKNDNSWTPPEVLEQTYDNAVLNPMVFKLKAGDINDDGLGDFVALIGYSKNGNSIEAIYPTIFYSIRGGGWVKTVLPALNGVNSVPTDLNLDLGNIDSDDDLDMVMTYNNGVYIFRNDGAWTRSLIETGVSNIKGVRLADMDAPSVIGNDPIRSMDIVVATSSTLMIYMNADDAGSYPLTSKMTLAASTGSTTVWDYALSEENLDGVVTGDLNLTRSEMNPLYHELITEEINYTVLTYYPSVKVNEGPAITDPLSDFEIDYETEIDRYYSVQPGYVMNITGWDSTNLNTPTGNEVVTLVIDYNAVGYDAGESNVIEMWNTTTDSYETLATIANGSNHIEKTLTYSSLAALSNLNIRLNNTDTGTPLSGTVDIDYMLFNITYPAYSGLEHIWRFDTTIGTGYTFNLYASMSSTSTDGDTFMFQYWNGAIWVDLTEITTSSWTSSSIAMTGFAGGEVFIKVIDTERDPSALSNDGVRVGQMYISCTATLTKIGKSIQAFDIADVDGNGANDIVVCTINQTKDTGDIWVLYNRDNYVGDPPVLQSGIFNSVNVQPIKTEESEIGLNVRWIEVGRFFGNWDDSYLDIVVGVEDTIETAVPSKLTASSFYYIDQTAPGVFSELTTLGFIGSYDVNKMIAEDVDGNGRTDIVLGTSDGRIVLWANYGGTLSLSPWAGYTWQRYDIDDLGGPIFDLSAGAFTA